MSWIVKVKKKAEKQIKKLPKNIQAAVGQLLIDIQNYGPVRGDWPNYGSLSNNLHHCHIKKGKPTYVAVWKVTDKSIKLVEITYAGTHEKTPY